MIDNYLKFTSMNFSSHKHHLADLIELALTKEKKDLIAKFKLILGQCNSLFDSERFIFWLRQIDSIAIDEIPITKHGLLEASRSVSDLRNRDRQGFQNSVLDICEQLFTYSDIVDLCPMQTKYHYYFYIPEQTVFKESEIGDCNLLYKIASPTQIRIAKISELNRDRSEFI